MGGSFVPSVIVSKPRDLGFFHITIMAASATQSHRYSFPSFVRGLHVYKDIWQPVLDEVLTCEIESTNLHDKHAVAVVKCDKSIKSIVGHVPREHSKVFKFFLRRGGIINATVTGPRLNRGQGLGLEVPVVYTFSGTANDMTALPTLLRV